MKLFDILNSEHKREENEKNNINVISEIDTIIAVMDNLGILDSKKIENNLKKENVEYDKSILKRLMISMDERKIQTLKKYYSPATIGYGSLKLREIKQQLIEKSIELSKVGKNKLEIIEELISYSQKYIDEYKNILEEFNNTIELIEKKSSTKSELFTLMDYWFNNYRVERLGYIPDIDNAIQTMVKNLEDLPYGGYGDKEIAKFKDEAIEMVQYGKANQEEPNIIINNVTKKLFEPRKNRYNTDLQALKRKIELIRSSSSITNEQKRINIGKTIAEFNVLYGHTLIVKEEKKSPKSDNSIFLIEVNIQKLLNISNGKGYGSSAIAYYRKKCEEVMNGTLDDAEKYVQINKIADSLIDEYNYNADLFYRWKETQLQKVSEEERKNSEEKLEKQVSYMLSLSPVDLKKYLLDDSKNKKAKIDKHNQEVIISYLAKKEASSKKDAELYDLRMQEYKNGNIPYSKKEYDNAYEILLLNSLIAEKDDDEDRIINAIEYVDSTLVQQIYSLGEKKTVTTK